MAPGPPGPRRGGSIRFDDIAAGLKLDARDPAAIRQRIEAMEFLLERSIPIPGIGRAIGLDSVIGLIPAIGDIVAAIMGAYIVWEARNLGLSKWQLLRMSGNVGFDMLLGAVPLVGDVFDLLFRSNSRNLKIIKRHLDRHHPATVTIEARRG